MQVTLTSWWFAVENQRERHATLAAHERLECVESEKSKPVKTGSVDMSYRT